MCLDIRDIKRRKSQLPVCVYFIILFPDNINLIMARTPIQPNSDHAPVSYREKGSWTVSKEDLDEALQCENEEPEDVGLFLYLKMTIPGTYMLLSEECNMPGWHWPAPYPGGIVRILKE